MACYVSLPLDARPATLTAACGSGARRQPCDVALASSGGLPAPSARLHRAQSFLVLSDGDLDVEVMQAALLVASDGLLSDGLNPCNLAPGLASAHPSYHAATHGAQAVVRLGVADRLGAFELLLQRGDGGGRQLHHLAGRKRVVARPRHQRRLLADVGALAARSLSPTLRICRGSS